MFASLLHCVHYLCIILCSNWNARKKAKHHRENISMDVFTLIFAAFMLLMVYLSFFHKCCSTKLWSERRFSMRWIIWNFYEWILHTSERKKKSGGRRLKCLLLRGECVTRTSHPCNDAAHKYLMLLVIRPFFHLASPCSLKRRNLLKVMRSLNVDWGQSIAQLPKQFTKFPIPIESRIFASVSERVFCVCHFKVASTFAHMQKASRARFAVFWRSHKVMKSTAKCFYLNAGYWTAERPSRRHYNRFYRASFSYIHSFFCVCCYDEKNRPKRSWHHTTVVYDCLLICHRRIGSAARSCIENENRKCSLISSVVAISSMISLCRLFPFNRIDGADSVDNPV